MGGAELAVSVWSLEEELLVPGPTRDSMKNDGFLGLGGDVRAGINGGPVPILVTVLGSLSLLLVPGGFGLLKGLVSLFLLPAGWSLPFLHESLRSVSSEAPSNWSKKSSEAPSTHGMTMPWRGGTLMSQHLPLATETREQAGDAI